MVTEKLDQMKKCCKNNRIILILVCILLLSIFCVLKFSKIEAWGILNDVVEKLLLCPKEETAAYEILSIFNNLSLAYIASFLFFLIVEYIPTLEKQKKAKEIISKQLTTVDSAMSYIIRLVLFEIGEEKIISDIKISDLSKVNSVFFNLPTKYAEITRTRNGIDCHEKEYVCDIDKCKTYSKIIEHSIDDIFQMPISGGISAPLLNLLSEIKQSRFLDILSRINDDYMRSIPGVDSFIINLDKDFYELIKYRKQLEKIVSEKIDYRFEKISEDALNNRMEAIIYMLGRSSFMRTQVRIIQNVLSFMDNIQLNDDKFDKLNGVLMEALVAYDTDNNKYGYILPIAKNIAEYLYKYDGKEDRKVIACLNYLQVLRRIGTYSKSNYKPARAIIESNKKDIYHLEALIILKNYSEARRIFAELDEGDQKTIRRLPIYHLWINPPLPAYLEPPRFNL